MHADQFLLSNLGPITASTFLLGHFLLPEVELPNQHTLYLIPHSPMLVGFFFLLFYFFFLLSV